MQKLFFILLIFLVFLRFLASRPVYKNGDFIRITTTVTTEPVVYDNKQYLKLSGLKVYLPKYPEVVYGDKVVVEGLVQDNSLKEPKLITLQEKTNPLFSFRQNLINFYKSNIPEPHASLLSGTILGSKQMPQSFWEKLRETGTAHVVVASGTNVSLVASFLMAVLSYILKRKQAIYFTLAGIFVYLTLSGFDAPLVRAGIMGSIAFLSQETGRLVNSSRLLFYTVIIMLLIRPDWILDLGFILSFVATVSLMLFQKRVDSKLTFVPNILREGLSTSLAAQIGVAPIIFATFGQFNILSPIINAIILWTIPYMMIIGAVGGILGMIIPVVGKIILYLSYPFTWWFVTAIDLF